MPSTSLRASRLTTVAAASGATNWLNRASWRLFNNGVLSPLVTSTRSGTATFFDSTGALQNAAANTPRVSYDPANLSLGPFLLAEEQRANAIRNNTMQGAVAGTPGTLPTNWSYLATVSGLEVRVVSVEKTQGVDTATLRFIGTPSSNNVRIFFDSVLPAASDGQVWTGSVYTQLVSVVTGSFQSLSLRITGSGATLDEVGTDFNLTSHLNRVQRTRTLSGGFTSVQTAIRFGFNVGQPIDITLRIGLPQLELGATASSPILTYGSAVTRAADNLQVSNLPATGFNAAEGTIYGDTQLEHYAVGTNPNIFGAYGASGSQNSICMFLAGASGNYRANIATGGSGQLLQNVASIANAFSRNKFAIAYRENDSNSWGRNGNTTDTTVTLPSVNRLEIGGGQSIARIYQAAIIPQRVPDSGLTRLTRI